MGCKSALYAANTAQVVGIGSVINFGQIIRRYGCHTNLSGGNVVLRGIGYYGFDSLFTFTGTGTATITFFKDGVAIPGATTSVTMVADTTYTASIPFILRETCDCESTITAVVSGASLSLTGASVKVVKL